MPDAETQPPRSPGHIAVARQGTAVLLRVVGLGNMNISYTMKEFVDQSLQSGYRHFAMDLARCLGMDSTFMGTIVGMARRIGQHQGWLCMLNVSAQNQALLDMIGVARFVACKDSFPLAGVETERLDWDADPVARLAHIRRAHEHLVAIDERNRERFGRFLEGLRTEMQGLSDETPAEEDPPLDIFAQRPLTESYSGMVNSDEPIVLPGSAETPPEKHAPPPSKD